MSGTRRVNWDDSPTSGSRGDHRRNDSGVAGTYSDTELPNSSNDYGESYSISRLRKDFEEALRRITEQKDRYKQKAEELDLDLSTKKIELAQVKKDLNEKEAQWRAVIERNEVLEANYENMLKQKNEEIAQLKDQVKRANRKSSSPPTSMTGAIPVETSDDKTPRRSGSHRKSSGRRGSMSMTQHDYERRQREQREEEDRLERERQDRLRKRMGNNAGEESDANVSRSSRGSGKSRGSEQSYIEPMGKAAPRPPVPQSPRGGGGGAQYNTYSTTQYGKPTYTPMRSEPVSGNVPRSVRPEVVYYDTNPVVDEYSSGTYQPYPLPPRRK